MYKKRKIFGIIFIFLLIVLSFQTVNAKNPIAWKKTFEFSEENIGQDIITTNDQGYLIGGYIHETTDEFFLLKLSNSGEKQWNSTWGSIGEDRIFSIIETDDGYFAIGDSYSYITQDFNILLVKFNKTGKYLWHKAYGGERDDHARKIIKTDDNNYAIIGYSNSFTETYDYQVLFKKIDSDGESIWTKIYGGDGNDRGFDVIQTSNDDFVLTGDTNSFDANSTDTWIVRIDSEGNVKWHRYYGGSRLDIGQKIIETNNGDLVITGYTDSYGAGSFDGFLLKTDQDGEKIWYRTYGEKDEEILKQIIKCNDQGFILTGYKKNTLSYDFYLVKTNREGYVEWTDTHNSLYDDEFSFSSEKVSEDNYVLAGAIQKTNSKIVFVIKTNYSHIKPTNLWPIADAGQDIQAGINEDIIFSVDNSYDSDGNITIYQWDFDGDGIYDWESNDPIDTTYNYNENGFYKAILKVTDNNNISTINERQITIGNLESKTEGSHLSGIIITIILILALFIFSYIYHKNKDLRKKIKDINFPIIKKFLQLNRWIHYLTFSFILLVLIKYLIGFLFQTPYIFHDAFAYVVIAGDVAKGAFPIIGETPFTHPYPAGYSYLLSPSYLLGSNMDIVYRGMLGITIILSAFTMFPAFFIMKYFTNKKTAFLTAISVSIIPTLSVHSFMIMSETALYLFFIFSCLSFIMSIKKRDKPKLSIFYSILTSIFIIFMVFIKAIAIVMIPAFIIAILSVIIYERCKKTAFLSAGIIPFIPIALYGLISDNSDLLGYNAQNYLDSIFEIFQNGELLVRFIEITTHEISYFILMGYIILAAFAVFIIINYKKILEKKRLPLLGFIIYGITTIAFLIMLTGFHIIKSNFVFYSRYVSVGMPFVFMLGIIGFYIYLKNRSKKTNLHIAIIFIVLTIFMALFFPDNFFKIMNCMDMFWMLNEIGLYGAANQALLAIKIISIAVMLPLFLYFIFKYIPKNKKYIDNKKTTINLIFLVTIISLIISGINFQTQVDWHNRVDDSNISEIGNYLNKNHPNDEIIIEDYFNMFSGGGMTLEVYSKYLHTSLHLWAPNINVSVVNKKNLYNMLQSDETNKGILISTHEFTDYYKYEKTIYLDMPITDLRTQEKIDINIYSLNKE